MCSGMSCGWFLNPVGSMLGVCDGHRFYQSFCGRGGFGHGSGELWLIVELRGCFLAVCTSTVVSTPGNITQWMKRVPRNNYCQTESVFSAIMENFWFRIKPLIMR